jgi:hypothetical protein
MIEKRGKILKVNSRYALVQLTNQTTNNLFTKLLVVISPSRLSNATVTIQARNSIYAQPNDNVIVGIPSQHFFSTLIKQANSCIGSSAIILRCTTTAKTC